MSTNPSGLPSQPGSGDERDPNPDTNPVTAPPPDKDLPPTEPSDSQASGR